MQRIRSVFVVLSLVLLVSLALLISWAFQSAASERSSRHRDVAERVLDEMERELTAFLRREENRPFEHYRHSYLPEVARQGTANAPVRSPLADPPEEPFLFGYFQLHPDGTFSTPHRGPTSYGPRPTEEALWVDRLEEAVRLVWRLQERDTASKDSRNTASKSTTSKDPLRRTGYVKSLNRGAQSRDRRPSKLEQTQYWNVLGFDDADAVEQEIREIEEEAAPGILDVRLEPMVGRRAGEGLMVLYRTVSIDERAYRQGLLIDSTLLVEWLAERVLTDAALASRAVFAADGAAAAGSPATDFAGYTYPYRFAEPFGSVEGVLFLEKLPEVAATTTYLTVLSILLVLTATLGLFGLYRMVAVVVEFAERRHNFVSAVTHELKTPLTAIRMYGEMLRDGVIPDDGKRQQYYETITAETERLTRLLQNVLELARLEKDTRTMNLVIGDVGQVIEEVAALLEPHAAAQGFVLRPDVEPGLPRARFDRDALVQVVFNLVDNALKYARKAEPREIVLACRRDGDGGVALVVADHGPGVSREHLRKIFEPFYRGENELTRTSKGTGIGLALVRGLVERMGGRVAGRNLVAGDAGAGGFEVVVSLSAV